VQEEEAWPDSKLREEYAMLKGRNEVLNGQLEVLNGQLEAAANRDGRNEVLKGRLEAGANRAGREINKLRRRIICSYSPGTCAVFKFLWVLTFTTGASFFGGRRWDTVRSFCRTTKDNALCIVPLRESVTMAAEDLEGAKQQGRAQAAKYKVDEISTSTLLVKSCKSVFKSGFILL
jgi:hypothetical protein